MIPLSAAYHELHRIHTSQSIAYTRCWETVALISVGPSTKVLTYYLQLVVLSRTPDTIQYHIEEASIQ